MNNCKEDKVLGAKKRSNENTRLPCKYWDKCYQKNPDHLKKYQHPKPKKEETNSVNHGSIKLSEQFSNTDNHSGNKRKSPEATTEVDDTSETEPKQKKQNVNEDVTPAQNTNLSSCDESEQPESIVEESRITKLNLSSAKVENQDPYAEAKLLITKTFLVPMPVDFYKFYDLCSELKPSDPTNAFKIADLKLVGPYDVLNGLINDDTVDEINTLLHWRYYYDPPEFQTIVKGNDKEGLHFGYWRDRPSSEPVFVATNCSEVNCKIKPMAENIFGAVLAYLEEKVKKANPFEKTAMMNIIGKVKAYSKKHNFILDMQSAKMKAREKNVVARTIHGAGIVCPYNKKSQVGYRELSVTDNQLINIVERINDAKHNKDRESSRSELGEVVRLATIAGDECDFGTCLELGHDLFSTGCFHVQNAALAVLNIAYSQLERLAFLKIVEAHIKNRKKGCNLSAFSSPLQK